MSKSLWFRIKSQFSKSGFHEEYPKKPLIKGKGFGTDFTLTSPT